MGLFGGGNASSKQQSSTISTPVTGADNSTVVANGSVKQDGALANISIGASSSTTGVGNSKQSQSNGGKGQFVINTQASGSTNQSGSAGNANNAGLILGAARNNKNSTITYNFTDGGAAKQAVDALTQINAQTMAQVSSQITAQNKTVDTASKSVADTAAGGLKNYLGMLIFGAFAIGGIWLGTRKKSD
jgi:hypothetical protein